MKFLRIFIYVSSIVSFANADILPQQNSNFVAVSDQPLASEVGVNILNSGGNAIDAAVAMGYALAVVDSCCGNIGGGGFMLIHLANGKDTVINFREKAPAAISPNLFFDKDGKQINSSTLGYLAVGVPGTVLGLNTALEKYGTLSLKQVMQPAIRLAEEGYTLQPHDARLLQWGANHFSQQNNVANIFLNNGKAFRTGEKLIQKNLALTLTTIADGGTNSFYRGKIAKEIVNASQANGGVISQQDLANYNIKEQQPISCDYRGYKIITNPPPGSGATVCEVLNISEGYPLRNLGYHSAMSGHYIIEAMRHAYADRNTFLGDPDFVKIPLEKFLSKNYAATIRQQILPCSAGDSKKLGFIATVPENQNTTSYAVADKLGNVVVVTYTLNGYFGAQVIPGNSGFFLNNELDDFAIQINKPNMFGLIQGKNNLIAPNKRPLSAISPVIITKNNQFFAAIGTPGGSTIPTQTLEAIEDLIDYDRNLNAAMKSARFHMQWLPDIVYMEPFAFSLLDIFKLNLMGYQLQLGSPYHTLIWGSMVGILKDPQSKNLIPATQS